MSLDLETVLAKVENLDFEELLTLQEQIIHQLRTKAPTPMVHSVEHSSSRWVEIPGAYRFSATEIEAELAESFTPEELAEIATTDLSNLPPGLKTVTEILSEDREDRF
ncbi:MAG: hypothetical protein WCS37_11955 [Chloroflexota bacterium]|nr:hypothetical protein [Chloroflexota bacterium]